MSERRAGDDAAKLSAFIEHLEKGGSVCVFHGRIDDDDGIAGKWFGQYITGVKKRFTDKLRGTKSYGEAVYGILWGSESNQLRNNACYDVTYHCKNQQGHGIDVKVYNSAAIDHGARCENKPQCKHKTGKGNIDEQKSTGESEKRPFIAESVSNNKHENADDKLCDGDEPIGNRINQNDQRI